jgi:hypothetical protein
MHRKCKIEGKIKRENFTCWTRDISPNEKKKVREGERKREISRGYFVSCYGLRMERNKQSRFGEREREREREREQRVKR